MKRGGLWVLLHKNNVLMCKYIRVHKYVSKRLVTLITQPSLIKQ